MPPRNSSRLRRWLLLCLGWMFLVLGVAGLFLPFLQGILFLAIGIVLLARQSMWVKRVLVRLRRRYPETAAKFAAASQRAHEFADRFRSSR